MHMTVLAPLESGRAACNKVRCKYSQLVDMPIMLVCVLDPAAGHANGTVCIIHGVSNHFIQAELIECHSIIHHIIMIQSLALSLTAGIFLLLSVIIDDLPDIALAFGVNATSLYQQLHPK